MNGEPAIELLYRALDAEYGIVISTNDPERLRQKLYRERKDIPELEALTFSSSPFNPNELWIVKHGQES